MHVVGHMQLYWALLSWRPRRVTWPLVVPPAQRLPVELLILVFQLVVGNYWRQSAILPYDLLLYRLTWVCQYWRTAALSAKELWADSNINVNTSLTMLRRRLTRSGSAPIRAHFDLHDDGYLYAADYVRPFAAHWGHTRDLLIRARTSQTMRSLTPLIQQGPFNALRSLHLVCCINNPPSLIDMAHPLPGMTSLRIKGVWFRWDRSTSFTSLTTLVIRSVSRAFAPTWDNWVSLAAAAPSIARLCLRNVGCRDIPANALTLLFPNIRAMDLDFGNDNSSLVALISVFDTPAITFLSIFSRTCAVLQSLLVRPDMLDGVTKLVLRLIAADVQSFRRFFLHTPNIQCMDVRASDHVLLSTLKTPSLPAMGNKMDAIFLCPNLTELAVVNARPSMVKELMIGRGNGPCPISWVVFLKGSWCDDTPEGEADVIWIRDRAKLGVRPDVFDPAWIITDDGQKIMP
ncbi:hypothetical protein C8R43DRAFT_1116315 [Mycena crocata]|nr:hypothetical protein C8R43DRAFT_1116315 [Mycena crocata]